ncbi:MAG: FG-GAP-like repeat-containing protein, partial [Gemmatimonadota bacterium]|nr:FG-GAP-like repeat-containing protein [Gemmatimonadota bacterium]
SVWAVAGDIDGDGDPDIVVINRAQKHILWRNNGHGVFLHSYIADGSAAQASGADLGDVDGDGDLDLIISQDNTQHNELFINTGSGDFVDQSSQRLPPESDDTKAVRFLDANMDGHQDICFANFGQPNRMLVNDGYGNFSALSNDRMPRSSGYTHAIAVGDINRDDQPDLYFSEDDRKNTLVFSRSFAITSSDLPGAFDLISPSHHDTVASNQGTFIWNASQNPDPTDSIRYTLILSLDSLFSANNLVRSEQVNKDTLVIINDLADSTEYWWKVEAENNYRIPVQSKQVNAFYVVHVDSMIVQDSLVFYVFVNRNPVFPSNMNIYIVASGPLTSGPTVTINQSPVSVLPHSTANIWLVRYSARQSFSITVAGLDWGGRTVEQTFSYSAVLASAGEPAMLAASGGGAWLTLNSLSRTGEAVLFAQNHEPVRDANLRARLVELGLVPDGSGSENLAAILEGGCFSFTDLGGRLETSAVVSISADCQAGSGSSGNAAAVCILENGAWVPLPTTYDSRTGAYSAVTEKLGTFSLRRIEGAPGTLQLPRGFALAQNSPNPFNPSTVISYSVSGGDASRPQVRIDVYDLRGARVRVLVNGPHDQGTYAVEWNGRDSEGASMPSGVYFYRMTTAGTVITRKMVLIR